MRHCYSVFSRKLWGYIFDISIVGLPSVVGLPAVDSILAVADFHAVTGLPLSMHAVSGTHAVAEVSSIF
jgi:hypothetical protein